jgi:hypothetical protein
MRRIEVVSALTSRWGSLDARIRRSVESLFEGALLREDRIVLDVRRIVSQLVAPTPPPPSPTMPTYSRQ